MKVTAEDKSNLAIFAGALGVVILCLLWGANLARMAEGFIVLVFDRAMVGPFFILLACVWLARMAFHHGRRDGHELSRGFWGAFGFMLAVCVLIQAALLPSLSAAFALGYATGCVLWFLAATIPAWVCGRCFRKPI